MKLNYDWLPKGRDKFYLLSVGEQTKLPPQIKHLWSIPYRQAVAKEGQDQTITLVKMPGCEDWKWYHSDRPVGYSTLCPGCEIEHSCGCCMFRQAMEERSL